MGSRNTVPAVHAACFCQAQPAHASQCQAQGEAHWFGNGPAKDAGQGAPLRMLRMVPLGLRHICFSPNSCTRASSGVMVAHCRTRDA